MESGHRDECQCSEELQVGGFLDPESRGGTAIAEGSALVSWDRYSLAFGFLARSQGVRFCSSSDRDKNMDCGRLSRSEYLARWEKIGGGLLLAGFPLQSRALFWLFL